ncbi:hypothetical protein QOL35_12375, partial [Acinetobacter baumannii]|nr:hypothetical protein [Acinetobacter baumannii]
MIVVNLSGRGDKDSDYVAEKIKKLYVKNSQDQNGEQICLN